MSYLDINYMYVMKNAAKYKEFEDLESCLDVMGGIKEDVKTRYNCMSFENKVEHIIEFKKKVDELKSCTVHNNEAFSNFLYKILNMYYYALFDFDEEVKSLFKENLKLAVSHLQIDDETKLIIFICAHLLNIKSFYDIGTELMDVLVTKEMLENDTTRDELLYFYNNDIVLPENKFKEIVGCLDKLYCGKMIRCKDMSGFWEDSRLTDEYWFSGLISGKFDLDDIPERLRGDKEFYASADKYMSDFDFNEEEYYKLLKKVDF